MPKPGNTGFTRLLKAAGYSWQGFKAAWQNESAFRQECILSLCLLPVAIIISNNLMQMAALIAVLALVLITELLNSAIEAVVDRIGEEHHVLAGRAKDMGSAAVFVSLSLVVIVWSLILLSNFLL